MLINSCVLIVPVDVRVCVYSVVGGEGGWQGSVHCSYVLYFYLCLGAVRGLDVLLLDVCVLREGTLQMC